MPHPWNKRDSAHGKLLVKSPSFCTPTKIQFKLQGGVSPTKDASASTYLGIVLVDEASGKVVKQQEQHRNTHTFKSYTWNLKNLNGKYHVELRDGKAGVWKDANGNNQRGWAHLELQGVIVNHSSCAGGGKCPGDFNGDNRVDAKDLLNLLGRFAAEKSHTYMGKHKGTKYSMPWLRSMCTGDLQGDGALDVLDLLKLLQARLYSVLPPLFPSDTPKTRTRIHLH